MPSRDATSRHCTGKQLLRAKASKPPQLAGPLTGQSSLASELAQCDGSVLQQSKGRQTRQTRPEPNRLTRPDPKTPQQTHRHCTVKLAPGTKPQNPTYLDKKGWQKKMRVACSIMVEKIPPPGANRASQKPNAQVGTHYAAWGGQKASQSPHNPRQKADGDITCKTCGRNTNNKKTRNKRVRAEDLTKPRRPGRRRGIKEGKEKHKRHQKPETKHGTPTLRCPEQKCACVLTCSPEMASEKPTKDSSPTAIMTKREKKDDYPNFHKRFANKTDFLKGDICLHMSCVSG